MHRAKVARTELDAHDMVARRDGQRCAEAGRGLGEERGDAAVEDPVGLVGPLVHLEPELDAVRERNYHLDAEKSHDPASHGCPEIRVDVTVGRGRGLQRSVREGIGRRVGGHGPADYRRRFGSGVASMGSGGVRGGPAGRADAAEARRYDPAVAPSGVVDLRSDTVTRPTAEMRKAMAEAEVGDDGFGEDPTVRELESLYAERVGKEAAVFVPSGTMANQIAVRVLARPGTAVVAGRREHVVAYEAGAAARNAAVQFHVVPDDDGLVHPAEVELAVSLTDYHQPVVSLVCVENTHMASGGTPWQLEELDALAAVAERRGIPVHMDGARLFNAEIATGAPASAMASRATTVMSCLSKGLCAPVGSLLAGPAEVIAAGRVERKRLGGAMRQAGIIAAAGIVALRTMVERLAEDHARARLLAAAVADRWAEAATTPARTSTNLVVFRCPDPRALVAHLATHGVLADMTEPGVVRLVTHHDVDDEAIERALVAIAKAP